MTRNRPKKNHPWNHDNIFKKAVNPKAQWQEEVDGGYTDGLGNMDTRNSSFGLGMVEG